MGVHQIAFKIQGADGKQKTAVFHCADTESIASIQAFITQIDQLLDDCLDGFITEVNVTQSMAFTVSGTTALADRQVDDGGLLAFSATGTGYKHGIYVPTFSLALIDDNKSIANAGASATLIAALLGGVNITLTDKYSNALSAFSSGKRSHRK